MAYTTTYPPPDSCVTATLAYTTSVPTLATYTTDIDVTTTVPGYTTTVQYTTCPYYPSCYTTYAASTVPPYVATTHVYTTITSTSYSPVVTYTYTTSCPPTTCPYASTVTVYSTVCPTTTYMSKRSFSSGQTSVTPVVVGVARVLSILVVLGLLIYYFLSKRASSKASRRLRLGDNSKESFGDAYGPMEAGPVRQYPQDSQPSVRAAQLSQYTDSNLYTGKRVQSPQQPVKL